MASDLDVLCVANKELLPDNTRVFLAENGVKYYYKTTCPHQLYVIKDGHKKNLHLNESVNIDAIDLNGSDIHFAANRKIYRVSYGNGEFYICRFRDLENGEYIIAQGLCRKITRVNDYSWIRDEYEYRHMRESTWMKFDNVKQLWGNPVRMHRRVGKLVLIKGDTCQHPRTYRLSDTLIGVDGRPDTTNTFQSFAQDSSPFIYYYSEQHFCTLNMDTLEAPPVLRFDGCYSDIFIAGVYDGVITATAKNNEDEKYYLITAPFPDGYFHKGWPVTTLTAALEKFKLANGEMIGKNSKLTKELDRMKTLNDEMKKNEMVDRNSELTKELSKMKILNDEKDSENKRVAQQLDDMKKQLIQCTIGSLTSVNRPLKFEELEKLTKPLVNIQLDNGALMYFDNVKPFELFIMKEGIRVNADLKLWEGEFDCTFRGAVNNYAHFAAIRGKIIKFFRASLENDQVTLEQIQELKTSEISLLKSEPVYFIERFKEWTLFTYEEKYTETEGEKFTISDIDFLSKYERHYHRGILYLFRETSTAKVEKVNEKVVIVEGPVLDDTSFYAPPHSNNIYILNSEHNVILILNTIDLTVSQLCYEAPAGTNNQSIVGIHNGMITMAFDGVWGRHLYSSK